MPTILHSARIRELHRRMAEQAARLEREAPLVSSARGARAGGDSRKLRGIPAIGRGVRGAAAGTIPGQGL